LIKKQIVPVIEKILAEALTDLTDDVYSITSSLPTTTKGRDKYICSLMMALREIGVVYSKYIQVGQQVNEIFDKILGFKLFRKRHIWNRCTEEAWYGAPISETPGWGGATGSAVDIGWILSKMTSSKIHFDRLKTKKHLCYIHIGGTEEMTKTTFIQNIFDAANDLDFDLPQTMDDIAKADPEHRAGVISEQRAHKTNIGEMEDEGYGEGNGGE
jgi:hypothetical protein